MKLNLLANILYGSVAIIACYSCSGNLQCQRETQLDRNWGRSYETARYQQIQNPEAEKNVSPVTGLEGRVGEKVMENYVKGESKKKSSRKEIGVLTIK